MKPPMGVREILGGVSHGLELSIKDPCVSNWAYGTYAVLGQLILTCDEPNYSGQVPLGEWKWSLCTDRAGPWRGKENTVQHEDS